MVYPTEDREKVLTAVNNLIDVRDIAEFEIRPGFHVIRGKGSGIECLTRLQNLLKQDRIRTAARAMLFSAMTANGLLFYINKQVAFVNHVSFCSVEGESPLGPITIKVECSSPTMVIDWLAPNIQGNVNE